ncbi:Peroxisomal membrane protein PAS20 [Vanrija albida]|uniref:Peroxisomal membrane protein PEX13 n=1 Tax=Vanrija albida TaxID=181172 RepID=A0ABR3Q7E1_9TREE
MSSLPPRPKPWETKAGTTPTASTPAAAPAATATVPASAFDSAAATSSLTAPALPDRPAGLGTDAGAMVPASGYGAGAYGSRYGTGAYGGMSSMSPYGGGYGGIGGGMGYSSYSSPYSRMGGYGGMGGYGSYGGMGGYGGYGGMGGYGVGGMGVPGEGYPPNLTASMQQSTAPAFAVIESLVTAFTSLAQLIESTYMATHSSFFAMVGVADQLGSLKTYLGQVLGVFSILRLGRRLINWLRGKKNGPPEGWANEWSAALNDAGLPGGPNAPRPSAKPLILFLLSAVGLPWLMSRLVKLLIANQQAQAAANGNLQALDANGNIDPTKLTFARARWEFRPSEEWELALTPDEIVAVLETREGQNGADGWWRGRTRDGRTGWFPGNYVEVIKKREGPPPPPAPVPPPGVRA